MRDTIVTITNTLSGKKELFTPLKSKKIALYVCGITPYDYAHLGHGRVYVTFDVLYRLLLFLGYEVAYVRNFTDIDDKLLVKAEKEFGDRLAYKKIADTYIASFQRDMQALNCLPPTYEPRVTEHMKEIIAFISGLIDAGKAYVAHGDVYFHIPNFPDYGKLSKQKLEDLRAGARVEVNDLKKDPLDFALWKGEAVGQFWKSPWGWGRPGWHIECSALATRYLGKQIDIHAGGQDLIFPHHENEIAQSEGLTGTPFASYWMHNAFVRVNQEKMSKSLGNFFTLRDIFVHADPIAIRYYILAHHYRAPLDFSLVDLSATQKSYQRLARVFDEVHCQELTPREIRESAIVQKMLEFLCDDLNTPGMFGVLFDHLDEIKNDISKLCPVKLFLQQVLGLTLKPIPEKEVTMTPEIEKLQHEREEARKAKDWARADAIRDKLVALGVQVRDTKSK
jgi:cysteinyl-tRNA synthetase